MENLPQSDSEEPPKFTQFARDIITICTSYLLSAVTRRRRVISYHDLENHSGRKWSINGIRDRKTGKVRRFYRRHDEPSLRSKIGGVYLCSCLFGRWSCFEKLTGGPFENSTVFQGRSTLCDNRFPLEGTPSAVLGGPTRMGKVIERGTSPGWEWWLNAPPLDNT